MSLLSPPSHATNSRQDMAHDIILWDAVKSRRKIAHCHFDENNHAGNLMSKKFVVDCDLEHLIVQDANPIPPALDGNGSLIQTTGKALRMQWRLDDDAAHWKGEVEFHLVPHDAWQVVFCRDLIREFKPEGMDFEKFLMMPAKYRESSGKYSPTQQVLASAQCSYKQRN